MGDPPSKPRRRAMERGCRYRMGDQCPCEDVIDCHCPDSILIAEQAKRVADLKRRFSGLMERWKRWKSTH